MTFQDNIETVFIKCPYCGIGTSINKNKLPTHEVIATCHTCNSKFSFLPSLTIGESSAPSNTNLSTTAQPDPFLKFEWDKPTEEAQRAATKKAPLLQSDNNTIKFPIKIDDFIFNNSYFITKSQKYYYCNIESLRFVIQNISINYSSDEHYIFSIRMRDDTIFNLQVGDAAFTINKKKVVEKKSNIKTVFNHINEITYDRRLGVYLNQLKNNNFILYKFLDQRIFGSKLKTVKICSDANIVMDNRIFNLKKARQTGTLKFGTAYGLGCDRTSDPYEISINEKKPILGGWAEGSGSLKIDGSWDYPIIFEILQSLS